MQLARDTARLLAREKKFQGALLPVEITQGKEPPEAFPARGYFRIERVSALQQRIEVALRGRSSATQRAKRAAGFGYRALGVPQLVARFRAAFFGLRDFRAQPFDSRSQGVELLRFALGDRGDRDELQHCAKQAADAAEVAEQRRERDFPRRAPR